MRYLLDANAVIALLDDPRSLLARRARREPPEDVGTSVIVIHELFYGAFKGRLTAQNLARLDAIQLEIVDFDTGDARQAGKIGALLASSGTPIGPYDILIAGQAVSRDLLLVTHNIIEFRRVPGLRCEDWEV
jgi:tRNA(fMet)-specific endonuclease VapC